MDNELEKIFNNGLKDVQPLLQKIEDEKTNLIVIKKFTQSMSNRENNAETKFIFKEIIDYVDGSIEALTRVENELAEKIKGAAFSISMDVVKLVTHEMSKEFVRQYQNEMQKNKSLY